MRPFVLVPYYIRWHYAEAPFVMVGIIKNWIWFVWHFFSVELLTRTLFSPFLRLHEERPDRFIVSEYFSMFFINVLMRIVGAFIRLIFIILGLISLIISIVLAVVLYCSWFILPIIILCLVCLGGIFILRTL